MVVQCSTVYYSEGRGEGAYPVIIGLRPTLETDIEHLVQLSRDGRDEIFSHPSLLLSPQTASISYQIAMGEGKPLPAMWPSGLSRELVPTGWLAIHTPSWSIITLCHYGTHGFDCILSKSFGYTSGRDLDQRTKYVILDHVAWAHNDIVATFLDHVNLWSVI